MYSNISMYSDVSLLITQARLILINNDDKIRVIFSNCKMHDFMINYTIILKIVLILRRKILLQFLESVLLSMKIV